MAEGNDLTVALHNCPGCSVLGKTCYTCFVVASSDQIIENIQIIRQNKTANLLYEVASKMAVDKVVTKNDEGKETIKKLKELAEEYTQLEFKTQRAVRTIQSYGKVCKEAAEDFLEDGNMEELLIEFGNIKEAKSALKDVTNNHNLIK
jgi:hypothetical protein